MANRSASSMSSQAPLPSSCFCVPWHKQVLQRKRQDAARSYTDADLAQDMNALTFEQRQILTEEIHGVSDELTETPEFVATKIREMQQALENIPSSNTYRAAWDRAVYLRPSLATDTDHFMMFLRTRRYDPFHAANWMLKFYNCKLELFGDDLLPHRLTWDDLTADEKDYVRKGVYLVLPKRSENPHDTQRLVYYRIFRWGNVSANPFPLNRTMMYLFMNEIAHNTDAQKEGMNAVVDFRGEDHWESSMMEILQFGGYCVPILENLPVRVLGIHFLVSDSRLAKFVQGIQAIFPRDWRVRLRLHVGSWMEMQYSLRTFGMNIPVDCSLLDQEVDESPFSTQAIEHRIQTFREADEQWRRSEERYKRVTSSLALYPNPQDILMGRNRKVTATWPGNVHFSKLIDSYAPLYLQLEDRREKTDMSTKIVQIIQEEQKARFLVRRGDLYWEALDSDEAHLKVGQTLRDEARRLLNQMKKTLNSL